MTKPAQAQAQRDRYVEQNLNLVRVIALFLMQRLPPSIEYDDLYQNGCLGLIEAASRYDPALNDNFRCYAMRRIKGAMHDSVRRRHWREANMLPITPAELEIPGDGAEAIERQIEHAQHARIVGQAVEALPPKQAKVIEIYFGRGGKLAGVGEEFGVKGTRSSQLLQEAKRGVARELGWRGLRAA
jgi:RNA polymerase sigma factor (sigma-70 family)